MKRYETWIYGGANYNYESINNTELHENFLKDIAISKWLNVIGPDLGREHIDGLAQDCSNSSALSMALLQFCTKPSTWSHRIYCATRVVMKAQWHIFGGHGTQHSNRNLLCQYSHKRVVHIENIYHTQRQGFRHWFSHTKKNLRRGNSPSHTIDLYAYRFGLRGFLLAF